MRLSVSRLLLSLLSAALLIEAINFARETGWTVTLGVLLLGTVLGRLITPYLKAHEPRVTAAHWVNSTVMLGTLFVESQATDMLCMVSNLVILLLIGGDEGPKLLRRFQLKLSKLGFQFTRPVIAPLA